MVKKQENKKQASSFSGKTWFENMIEDNPILAFLLIVCCAFLLYLLLCSNMTYWFTSSCLDEGGDCTFNPHGYTLKNVFLTFLLGVEIFFIVTLFLIKRKKNESIWHYTLIMKLYSLLFSASMGILAYVVVIPLSWVIGKFVPLLPKIIIIIILHTWKPALLLVVLATIAGAWYLINVGFAKLFGSQDG